MSVLNAAILGCGAVGADHATVLSGRHDTRVSVLIGSERSTAALAAKLDSRPTCYRTLDEALADRAVDVVAICTPSALHADAAVAVLAAGRHVVIEKPVDTDVVRARRLLDAADAARARGGLVASVISQRRFDPGAMQLHSAVVAGELGSLTSATATAPWWRSQAYYDSARWRGTWELDGGGALMNQGVHTVDLLIWLLGVPRRVTGWTATLAHSGLEVEDTAAAVIEFESGALATVHVTTANFPGAPLRIQLGGTGGTATLVADRLVEMSGRAIEPVTGPPAATIEGLATQYEDIIGSITAGREPAVGVADGLMALAVVTAVYRSTRTDRPVEIRSLLESPPV